MAASRELDVFRTPIGFHDAYVAAKQGGAGGLGSGAGLLARGVAEVVTHPALTAELLAHSGTAIWRLRGGLAKQAAAAQPFAKPKPVDRAKEPSRAVLDRVEAAVMVAERGGHGRP